MALDFILRRQGADFLKEELLLRCSPLTSLFYYIGPHCSFMDIDRSRFTWRAFAHSTSYDRGWAELWHFCRRKAQQKYQSSWKRACCGRRKAHQKLTLYQWGVEIAQQYMGTERTLSIGKACATRGTFMALFHRVFVESLSLQSSRWRSYKSYCKTEEKMVLCLPHRIRKIFADLRRSSPPKTVTLSYRVITERKGQRQPVRTVDLKEGDIVVFSGWRRKAHRYPCNECDRILRENPKCRHRY